MKCEWETRLVKDCISNKDRPRVWVRDQGCRLPTDICLAWVACRGMMGTHWPTSLLTFDTVQRGVS